MELKHIHPVIQLREQWKVTSGKEDKGMVYVELLETVEQVENDGKVYFDFGDGDIELVGSNLSMEIPRCCLSNMWGRLYA